jgi:SAM-dependent methyltransferase
MWSVLRALGALRAVLAWNRFVRRLAAVSHKAQLRLEWATGNPPEWYDTFIGQYYAWREERIAWIWDRGVLNTLCLKPGGRLLDICCGGGFYDYHFYAPRAREVLAVDFDPNAIAHAQRNNAASNIHYLVADIRESLPQGPFDNVIWDGAIEHFTPDEIDGLIRRIKERLAPGGVLSGYTVAEREEGMHHPDHEYEFKSKDDLRRFFTPYFANVVVIETVYPERHNLHFMASDGDLPM